MKKILMICAVVMTAVSCLQGSGFHTNMTSIVTFDYDDTEFTDSLFYDTKYSKVGFVWDFMEFYHKVDEMTLDFKGGFLVSSLVTPMSGNTEGFKNNRYRSNVKNELSPRNKYAVFCYNTTLPEKHMAFNLAGSGFEGSCNMKLMQVSNTVEVEEAIKRTFVDGDQLVFRATGYLENQITDKAEVKLAEYTSAKDSIVSTWTTLDLTKLGKVDKIQFEIDMPVGKNIPYAVCVDNIVSEIALSLE